MRFFKFFMIYVIGFLLSFATVMLSAFVIKTVWSYGLAETTGYGMTYSVACMVSMLIVLLNTIVRDRSNDKKYYDVDEALVKMFEVWINKVTSIILCWFSIWLMSMVLF